ncbi:polysaccharide pyruvyl transferase family protein [Xylanimonas ulmi]|uniref:Pyruvyl transferase n=1 Tax=Xylanimonas ulmi TaxID=228973 RepID=A0A4Q7M3T4_9MICO|nr:polysaccharide pyruvyl transferase family protein [Xylanibacterium ulmi]RZS62605.1 pyruvyl transferase [Xylanibacterium ulmi]
MARVEVVHWNPLRRRRRTLRERLLGRHPAVPVDNFGDLLGPLVVRLLLAARGVEADPTDDAAPARLLAVGSILHLARDGDTVWGSGVNGKIPLDEVRARSLDVRAVRGPRTREALARLGVQAPAVYGDPALLLATLDPRLRAWAADPVHDVTLVPNVHDLPAHRGHPALVSPTAPLDTVLERVARSRLVVGSSLHGLVVAESLGIPARAVVAGHEDPLKYDDYYRGTGRDGFHPAASVAEAVRLGGEPAPRWDPGPLLAAFPEDLWAPAPARGAGAGAA